MRGRAWKQLLLGWRGCWVLLIFEAADHIQPQYRWSLLQRRHDGTPRLVCLHEGAPSLCFGAEE